MPARWSILALLFAVGTAMAFQFQSVAALAPLLGHFLSGIGGVLLNVLMSKGVTDCLPAKKSRRRCTCRDKGEG